jgi:hypothetical protein
MRHDHICDPEPTELAGYDSAGVLVGTATFHANAAADGKVYPHWRIAWRNKTHEHYCEEWQVRRELAAAGAVRIQEGEARR